MLMEYQTVSLEYYTEGPAMDNDGNVYCTTLTGGEILKIDRTGNSSIWGRSTCPNGQVILANGDHLVCDSRLATIIRYGSTGIRQGNEIDQTCNGKKIFVPNDLVVDRDEGIYFTDSIRNDGKVCYRSKDGREYIVAVDLDYPNGLALSWDEKTLFVAESYKNRIISIELERPGIRANEIHVFADLPVHDSGNVESNLPDGIALDNNNNLWVAHYGMQAIQVINKDGRVVDSVDMPFPLVSNLYFSQKDYSEIIVTGGYNEPGPGAISIITLKS
jgi:gluconolactonase